ncbi:YitT family protein [Mycoplasma sp. 744]|uniref:YitT family protein n=1 Tax=Mycoplasma sp. 744 TaxID=3108531 RepID=UPI002B1D452E|nr:YitT family protein [Mycoplasma sp. 744]MEA4115625.1 YitT family protein [Mycoplasma sp. 744]
MKNVFNKKNKNNIIDNAVQNEHKWNTYRICDIDINMTEMAQYNYKKLNSKNKEVRKQNIKLYIRRIFFIFLAALLFNFGVITFLSKAHTIPSGFTGIPTLIVFLVKNHWKDIDKLFALIYIIVNIPLFIIVGLEFKKTKIFPYFKINLKIKKSFLLLSLCFMIFQVVSNSILTIEVVNKFIVNLFNVAPGWTETIVVNGMELENPNTWPIFINGIIGSALLGIAIATAWKNGGSTGGSDFIAYYFTTKKKKSVSSILMIVSFTSSLIFLVIFSIINPHKPGVQMIYDANGTVSYQMLTTQRAWIGMREVSTIFYIFIANGIVGILYPKYKKMSIEISCSDPSKVIAYFIGIDYWHAYSISKVTSGYTGKEIYKIETTVLLLETKSIVRDLKRIDNSVWIKIKPVHSVIGNFKTSFVE